MSIAHAATNTVVDRVKDGPHAATIRESLQCLEHGESATDDAVKLDWYRRGKVLAETALRKDDENADAHFAYFANWGRWLQVDGWVKNAYHLPSLWGELDRTLELDPEHSDALAAKGGLYLRLPRFLGGDAKKAEPLLVRSVELDPHAVGARLELAELYGSRGLRDEARDHALTALELAERDDKPRYFPRARKILRDLGVDVDEARISRRGPLVPLVPRGDGPIAR